MKRKRLSEAERTFLKNKFGIIISNSDKACGNCFNYTEQRVCHKHFIATKGNEYCKNYSQIRNIKIFRGGSASSK